MNSKLKKINELIDLFKHNEKQYKSAIYDEANTRVDFIDKFFELLDWDVRNAQGFAENYREVVREDKVIIKGKPKAPDYSFRIGGFRKFFVEAKKPGVNIKDDILSAFQVRRYGYTAKVPLSILTDFEEFSVYDTRIKPNKNDKASAGRIFYCSYEEYIKNFDFIYNTFSKNAILKGSFDKYIEENKRKKGTSEVDKEFLSLIEDSRNNLAKNIAIRNTDLSIYELNYAVQKIIDRIIFLRIAEDRQMEEYSNLKNSVLKENIYTSLNDIFKKADDKYNSGIFKKEQFFDNLKIDNKVLKPILNGLYYPDCPYEFSIFSTEILGNIYEQFLGKTIRLTSSHQAKVEEKSEVRKAGGVYYTPQYIVDYIVQNTVGKKIKNKTPVQIKKIKICDPACGSGSFLIGAYRFLLNYHLQFYIKDNNRLKALKNNCIYQVSENNWALTINEKQKILLNNIFGVDIDSQAVEVTKLSLLLKLMEGENEESAGSFFKFSDLQLLPDLSENIKCGNSLVGSEYYSSVQMSLFSNEQIREVNAFDWKNEFKNIFENKGFDIVIGNPPYIKEDVKKEIFELVRKSKNSKYYQGKMDFWYLFACFSIDILKPNGLHSFIAQNNWITSFGASILRKKILTDTQILSFLDFNDFKVFENASIQTMIYILEKKKSAENYNVDYYKVINKKATVDELSNFINSTKSKFDFIEKFKANIIPKQIINETINFINSEIGFIINKIKESGNYYLQSNEIGNGIDVLQDFVSKNHIAKLKNDTIKIGNGIFVLTDNEILKFNFNKNELGKLKPYYTPKQLEKYYGNIKNEYEIIYADKDVRSNIQNYPNFKKHLDIFKNVLTSAFAPYGLNRPREQRFFEGEKILSLRKTMKVSFSYTDFPCYVSRAFLIIKTETINNKYLTGILNSELINFWLYHMGKKQGEQLQVDKDPLLSIPILFSKENENQVIEIVNQLIDNSKSIFQMKNSIDNKIVLQRRNILEKQLNDLVYKIYNISNNERQIIEN